MDQSQDRQSQPRDQGGRQGSYVLSGQEFTRDTHYIQDRIVADPTAITAAPRVETDKVGHVAGGLTADAQAWPVEAGRYRLVAARACPWANRTIIVRRLLGLEDAISLGTPGPTHDERSWTFDLDPDGRDPVLGTERLQENYFTRFPDYPRGITVPAIVDIPTGAVVTNDYPQITLDFSTQWTAYHRDGAPDLLPEGSLDEMHEVMTRIFTEVNNGVYRCGFAGSQEAYDSAYDRLWTALDWLEERLTSRRYLMGDTITEADVRLFTTLVRFDPVYHGHFKCNRNTLDRMPALWGYARDLFQTPGFGDTVDFDQIKSHYYEVHRDINPTGIVPKGPELSGWLGEHRREELGGSPFGDGTAPGPVREDERVTPGHNPLYPA
ncbi:MULTISPECIES: glutathione S-transferase family protein [Micrococcaceae]|uniref:glutathione S-transferase family protein n=1 Tax=Micrococcaceae TaxID=1268 RepID=UPI0016102C8A|nr:MULTISPECIES: glutathione S-transferase C-terminal domain-containing protein [Micrococcaceae]MBB5749946.1 putative glutathione S-transferase [Micrococcus sp. TA1]HRO31263.1 glutathione S-transferase C-terminal domain-containing protein [Citricoccus sp.]HRO93198.1 glutathione S-transferase C-terminal domain-containing protein [Citricoccus sp.]